jgi:hypothetical protein
VQADAIHPREAVGIDMVSGYVHDVSSQQFTILLDKWTALVICMGVGRFFIGVFLVLWSSGPMAKPRLLVLCPGSRLFALLVKGYNDLSDVYEHGESF